MPGPRRFMLAVVAVVIAAGTTDIGTKPAPAAEESVTIIEKIRKYRTITWRWQRVMSRPLTPTGRTLLRTQTLEYRLWVLRWWRAKARRVYLRAQDPPLRSAWLCIHRYEGPWQANTGKGYYGGLQMNIAFQRAYGPGLLRRKGTANRWTPLEQMWVAERAYRSGRGFSPWPNRARYCGLI